MRRPPAPQGEARAGHRGRTKGRVRPLERLWLERAIREAPDLTLERSPLLRPESLHHPDPLRESTELPIGGKAEAGERRERMSQADAGVQAATAQHVEHRQLTRNLGRVVAGEDEHRDAKADALRVAGDEREQGDRRQLWLARHGVVHRPEAGIAKLLGPTADARCQRRISSLGYVQCKARPRLAHAAGRYQSRIGAKARLEQPRADEGARTLRMSLGPRTRARYARTAGAMLPLWQRLKWSLACR